MSHPIYLTKTSKVELTLTGLVFVAAAVATLVGLFGFTKSPDVVAEHAVETQGNVSGGGLAEVSYVDEQNNYYVSDGGKIFDVKMSKGTNGWAVQSINQTGAVKTDADQ